MNLPLWLASPGLLILMRWTCLLALGWMVHWVLRRRHSQWRMILWRDILCSGLVLPLLQFFPVPGVRIPVRISHSPPQEVVAVQIRPAVSATAQPAQLPPAADPVSRVPKTLPHTESARTVAWGDICAAVWILGCIFGLFRLVRLQIRLSHLRKNCQPIPELQRLATEIQKRLDVSWVRDIDVRISEDVSSPFICGLVQPAIILPKGLAQNLSPGEMSALLSHEIAHLRQHDLFWCVAWQGMKVVSWFHPFAWNIPAAHNLACEQEADRVAAGQLGNENSYAQMLARLALQVLALPAVETKLTLNGSSQITRRLNYLGQKGIGAWNWKFSAAGLGIVALIFLLTAGSGFSILPASAPQDAGGDAPFPIDYGNGWKMVYINGVIELLRTADEGKHWMDVSPPALAVAAKGRDADYLGESTAICPLDAQRAWMAVIIKDRVMLEFTSSGGLHWEERGGPPAMEAVHISFPDEQTGFLLNSSDTSAGHQLKEVYGTQDGGRLWTKLTSPNLQGTAYYTTGISFRSRQVGWVTGTYHGAPDAPLFRTEDGGKTWSVQKLPFPPDYQGGYADIDPPAFVGAGKVHGYLPVTLVRNAPDHRAWVKYATDDGGLTWHLRANPEEDWIKDLNSPDIAVRRVAIGKIQTMDDPRIPAACLPLLNDPGLSIRRLAARAIGSRFYLIADRPRYIAALEACLESRKDQPVEGTYHDVDDITLMCQRAIGLLSRKYDSPPFSLSPNGKWVLYESRRLPNIIDAVTQRYYSLRPPDPNGYGPDDAYYSDEQDNAGVPDTNILKTVDTNLPADQLFAPHWRSDGQALAFSLERLERRFYHPILVWSAAAPSHVLVLDEAFFQTLLGARYPQWGTTTDFVAWNADKVMIRVYNCDYPEEGHPPDPGLIVSYNIGDGEIALER